MVEFSKTPPRLLAGEGEDPDQSILSTSSEEGTPSSNSKSKSQVKEGQSKKRKRKGKSEKGSKVNGSSSRSKRRQSVSKLARDPQYFSVVSVKREPESLEYRVQYQSCHEWVKNTHCAYINFAGSDV